MTDQYDVAIVGSGPTGLTLANLLGMAGLRTVLVERNLATVQEPRAVSIDDESLRTMQAAGVLDTVLPALVPGYGSRYYTASGLCFARVEPTGQPYGYPRRNAFRQPVLEQQLRDALARFAHVHTRFGWSLDRYDARTGGVTLHLAGPGGPGQVDAAYLVGCDGAASRVRDQLGTALEGTTFDERWLIVDLENHENTTRHTKVFCNRNRPCITLPGPDRTRRFEFKLLPGETDATLLDPATLAALLRRHGADPAATIRRKTVYRFHARVAPQWAFGRVLLAGDAAHLTPPFAGQGMNSGIRDAQNLAWKLAAVLRGQAGPALLDSYEHERKDHVWQMIALALRMGRIMAPPSRLHGALTQGAFLALNLVPPARDYVAQMKYKPPPRFHRGFLLPDGQGRRSMVGRMLPQPMVRTPSATVLLDAALGPGFALLLRTADPAAGFARLTHPVWRTLGARRLALLPAGATPHDGPDWAAVAETGPVLAQALSRYEGCALLLRPDRYIAAAIPLAEPGRMERAVAAMLAATWPGTDQDSVAKAA